MHLGLTHMAHFPCNLATISTDFYLFQNFILFIVLKEMFVFEVFTLIFKNNYNNSNENFNIKFKI
jgi:hypothetical protein